METFLDDKYTNKYSSLFDQYFAENNVKKIKELIPLAQKKPRVKVA